MMIDAPDHTLTARTFLPGRAREHTSPVEWVLKRIQIVVCSLRGHDSVLQYERTRMFLRCTSCGHETPGWEVVPASLVMTRAEPRARSTATEFTIVRKVA
jgi:hypothetical protein